MGAYSLVAFPGSVRGVRNDTGWHATARIPAPLCVLVRGTIVNIGPMVYTNTYIFTYFYAQYFVLFTMVPRNSICVACFVLYAACVYIFEIRRDGSWPVFVATGYEFRETS